MYVDFRLGFSQLNVEFSPSPSRRPLNTRTQNRVESPPAPGKILNTKDVDCGITKEEEEELKKREMDDKRGEEIKEQDKLKERRRN